MPSFSNCKVYFVIMLSNADDFGQSNESDNESAPTDPETIKKSKRRTNLRKTTEELEDIDDAMDEDEDSGLSIAARKRHLPVRSTINHTTKLPNADDCGQNDDSDKESDDVIVKKKARMAHEVRLPTQGRTSEECEDDFIPTNTPNDHRVSIQNKEG